VKTAPIRFVIALAAMGVACPAVDAAFPENPPRVVAAAEPTQPAPPVNRAGPASERRTFAVATTDAWKTVQARLVELGLAADKTDPVHQLLLTRRLKLNQKAPAWLLAARSAVPAGLDDVRAQFLVFVSPFAQRTHVYVGSVVDGVPLARREMFYYNVRAFNQALMGELATALEREAEARAPADGGGARSTMPGGVPAACRAPEGATGPVPPERIALSKFQFIYPAAALKNGTESPIQVALTILEDGGVTDLRVISKDVGDQLEESALGVSSLMLFTPARVGTTCIGTRATITVNYQILRAP
jgi:TonB family protein